MGLYGIYESAFIFADMFIQNKKLISVISFATFLAIAVWAVMFTFQSIGLYKMAKKRNMGKRFLAFIPFANIYYMGKLAGDAVVFGQRMKNPGLYAMIAETVSTSLCITALALQYYLYFQCGDPLSAGYGIFPYWDVVGGSLNALITFYNVVVGLLMIFQLIAMILMIILLSALYKKYAPKQYFLLGFLTVMLPARYIIIFALRNRRAIDYEAYIRARREAYFRQQQQYHQQRYGGYANPYNNPYGEYQNPARQNEQKKPEDPFEEFSGGNKPEDTASENGQNTEDFFN